MQRDRQMAKDLVQEVFFQMLRYRGTYNAGQSFTGWMYQIARNAAAVERAGGAASRRAGSQVARPL